MKLLTHNMLRCAVQGVQSGYPLQRRCCLPASSSAPASLQGLHLSLTPSLQKGFPAWRAHSTPSDTAMGVQSNEAGAVDVKELADKARLRLSDEESLEFQDSVSRIVGWFGQLQAADVAAVEPAVHAAVFAQSGVESLRRDEVGAFLEREAMLGEVPSREGPYIKVPRILGGGDSE